jgi:hypothetical protein
MFNYLKNRPDSAALLFLMVIAISLMSPYLFDVTVVMWPRSGLGTDLTTYNWPPFEYLRQSIQHTGQIPLWWSSTMGGIPLIGNPGVRIYYPPLLLLALLPIPIPLAFALVNTFHIWLAGSGAYGIARLMLKTGRTAALFGGLAVLLTPRLSSNLVGDMGYTAGLCWTPLSILCVYLALNRSSWRWAVIAGIVLAVLYILNFVIIVYLGFLIGIYTLYLVVKIFSRRQSGHQIGAATARLSALLIVIGLVAAGVAAFHWLPFLSYLPYQSREAMTLEDANYLTLPLPFLINFILPTAFKFPEWEAYAGLLLLVLLPLAFLHPNRASRRLWLFVLIFAGLFSLGSATPLYSLMYQFVPGFRLMRVPARMLYFAVIALALLASLSVDYLMQNQQRHLGKNIWRWLIWSSVSLSVVTVVGRFLTRRPGELDWLLGSTVSLGLLLLLFSLWRWRRHRLNAWQLAAALMFVLLLDLFPLAATFASPKPVHEVFAQPEITAAIPEVTSPNDGVMGRLYSTRRELPDHIIVSQNWQVADGLNSFQFASYARYMRLASGCTLSGLTAAVPPCASNELSDTAYREAVPDANLLGAMNVHYVITSFDLPANTFFKLLASEGDQRLYENLAVLPRAYGVGRVEMLANPAEVWDQLTKTTLQQVVLVEPQPMVDFSPTQNDVFVPAQIINYQSDQVQIRISMPTDGMLILADAWVPGWQAWIDHQQLPVLRVNGALRGVYLKAGTHEVLFRFMPSTFTLGFMLTMATIAASATALVWRRQALYQVE